MLWRVQRKSINCGELDIAGHIGMLFLHLSGSLWVIIRIHCNCCELKLIIAAIASMKTQLQYKVNITFKAHRSLR